MHSRDELALEFARRQPAAAARALENLEPAWTADVLQNLPARTAANVLARMLHRYGARALALMTAGDCAEVLRNVSPQLVSLLLRNQQKVHRDAIVSALPGVQAAAVRYLLGLPVSAIDAWLDSDSFTVTDDMDVGEIRRRLRPEGVPPGQRIFVLDRDKRIRAFVFSSALIAADDRTSLSSIWHQHVDTLPAGQSVETAGEHEDWTRFEEMPVVQRGGHFVGVLSRTSLLRARQIVAGAIQEEIVDMESDEEGLARIYAAGAAGAWRAWIDLVSPETEKS